ncbi:MAG: bacteriophage holin [Kiloniellales bacterium]
MAENGQRATLGVISFGLALGVTTALFTFVLGLMAAFFGWGVELAAVMASLYVGYSPTFVGTITGTVWGFVDGFVAGILIAWLYNRFLLRRGARIPEKSE